jgi:hypothetical protein
MQNIWLYCDTRVIHIMQAKKKKTKQNYKSTISEGWVKKYNKKGSKTK